MKVMSAVRQDAWTPEDDLMLAEVTLRHIREGSTQLSAFEEVGQRIGRTPAACGFRWNSCVRKKYDAAIQIAKAQRQKRNSRKSAALEERTGGAGAERSGKSASATEESVSIDSIIRFLRQWKQSQGELTRTIRQLEKQLQEKEEEIAKLKAENERLASEVNNVQTDYQAVNEDYKALIKIMERARKMAFLVDEDEEELKSRFKMDANGNLERIE